jgi:hypothetical protein
MLTTGTELVRLTRFAKERGIPERTLRDWGRRGFLNRETGLHHVGTIVFIHPKEFDAFFLDNENLIRPHGLGKRGRKKKVKPT